MALDIQEAIRLYKEIGSVHKVGKLMGVHGQTIHNNLKPLGHIPDVKPFLTDEQEAFLKENYRDYVDRKGGLQALSDLMGKPKSNLARHARKLGLTDKHVKHSRKLGRALTAPESEPIMECLLCGSPFKSKRLKERQTCSKTCRDALNSNTRVGWHKENPHPKGMLGKSHTPEFKEKMSRRSIAYHENTPIEVQRQTKLKMLKTKLEKYGTLVTPRAQTTWKQGWRLIGETKKYYRSKWEANYARYLEFLKRQNQILKWEHEPETFWFEGLKRGTMSYLPDFRVTKLDGAIEYHEVKGWMDDRSKTKIKRMAKYYPDVVLKVYAKKEYNIIKKQVSGLIPDWE